MTDYDREELQRHMAARMAQLARLQRLDHLGPRTGDHLEEPCIRNLCGGNGQ
jgi:hypothetical protein